LAADCGFTDESNPLKIFEVSCSTLENINQLYERSLETVLSHTSMGERVPKSYLVVENALRDPLKQVGSNLPLVDIQAIMDLCKPVMELDRVIVQRALNLLSAWGECVYFDKPEELASTVILDPKFLTKEVLGQLFNPKLISYYKNGIVHHSDLIHIWSAFKDRDFDNLAPRLMVLMEKFEVCFIIRPEEDQPKEDAGKEVVEKQGEESAANINEESTSKIEEASNRKDQEEEKGENDKEQQPLVKEMTKEEKDLYIKKFFTQSSLIPVLLPEKPNPDLLTSSNPTPNLQIPKRKKF